MEMHETLGLLCGRNVALPTRSYGPPSFLASAPASHCCVTSGWLPSREHGARVMCADFLCAVAKGRVGHCKDGVVSYVLKYLYVPKCFPIFICKNIRRCVQAIGSSLHLSPVHTFPHWKKNGFPLHTSFLCDRAILGLSWRSLKMSA